MSKRALEGEDLPSESAVGSIGRPRRLPLEALRGLNRPLREPRWRHHVIDIDSVGRITLPSEARGLVDESRGTIGATSRRLALLLSHSENEGAGVELRVDGRGRLRLPAWVCRLAEPTGSVLLAVRQHGDPVVVVTPAEALDAVVDSLVEEVEA